MQNKGILVAFRWFFAVHDKEIMFNQCLNIGQIYLKGFGWNKSHKNEQNLERVAIKDEANADRKKQLYEFSMVLNNEPFIRILIHHSCRKLIETMFFPGGGYSGGHGGGYSGGHGGSTSVVRVIKVKSHNYNQKPMVIPAQNYLLLNGMISFWLGEEKKQKD